MAEQGSLTIEDFRVIVERSGLSLSDEELSALKPMYEHHLAQTASLHEVQLDAEDLAVAFNPGWDPS